MDAKIFAEQGEKYLGTPYDEMDCQAFVEQMLSDVGIVRNWPGSNAMGRDMRWIGTPEECKKKFGFIPVGAWLFILKQDGGEPEKYKADQIGNFSHVGVKTGVGEKGAIHSSSTRKCVAWSTFNDATIKNGGWNMVGLCKLLDYGKKIDEILTQNEVDAMVEEMANATIVAENGLPVNFRKAPAAYSTIYDKLPVGTRVTVTGENGGWYTVMYNGKTGYIMKQFVKMEPKTEVSDPSSLENRLKTVEENLEKLMNEWGDKMGWG